MKGERERCVLKSRGRKSEMKGGDRERDERRHVETGKSREIGRESRDRARERGRERGKDRARKREREGAERGEREQREREGVTQRRVRERADRGERESTEKGERQERVCVAATLPSAPCISPYISV
jgi:hypothetical protein